jgi:hypothetical protein
MEEGGIGRKVKKIETIVDKKTRVIGCGKTKEWSTEKRLVQRMNDSGVNKKIKKNRTMLVGSGSRRCSFRGIEKLCVSFILSGC